MFLCWLIYGADQVILPASPSYVDNSWKWAYGVDLTINTERRVARNFFRLLKISDCSLKSKIPHGVLLRPYSNTGRGADSDCEGKRCVGWFDVWFCSERSTRGSRTLWDRFYWFIELWLLASRFHVLMGFVHSLVFCLCRMRCIHKG